MLNCTNLVENILGPNSWIFEGPKSISFTINGVYSNEHDDFPTVVRLGVGMAS